MRLPFLLLACLIPAAASATGGYRVGPGDILDVEVTQETKLTGQYTVSEAGSIELDLVGAVDVSGRTPEQIDELLTTKLKVYFKAPTVRLKVAEYHSQKAYVLGAVSKPGAITLQGEKSLLDVVLEAGGTTPQSLGRLVLIRAEAGGKAGTAMSVELDKLLAGGVTGPSNSPIENGDVVFVPQTDLGLAGAGGVVDPSGASVTVVGEVTKPGVFRLETGATALAAVLAAGGVTKYAAPNRAKVIRAKGNGREVLELELGDILKYGEKKKDVTLEPGDMVIVPARLF
jgi:polysaccharide biosynthesis/export protein